ncbi:MAG: hypothetical protein HYX94_00995 [Chloroflexi bacterium]|nr:hypothetical protein [Chloroflexota bacterium]
MRDQLVRYPESPESREATASMLALARDFEREGTLRLALSLYEKLEKLQ